VCNGKQLLSFTSFVLGFLLETTALMTLIFLIHTSMKSSSFVYNNCPVTAGAINIKWNEYNIVNSIQEKSKPDFLCAVLLFLCSYVTMKAIKRRVSWHVTPSCLA
jgi:hypothetical protein